MVERKRVGERPSLHAHGIGRGGVAPDRAIEDDRARSRRGKEAAVPRHWWLPVPPSSDCASRKSELRQALGSDGKIVRYWKGRKTDTCYALVEGEIDNVPGDIKRGAVKVVDADDVLDDA
jgi:hypothetical protein